MGTWLSQSAWEYSKHGIKQQMEVQQFQSVEWPLQTKTLYRVVWAILTEGKQYSKFTYIYIYIYA
jgi:hypothetical protein